MRRPVIDLSSLNKFIVNERFQMEHLSCLKTLLLPGDFITNVDLKDAYLSVGVHEQSQRFLPNPSFRPLFGPQVIHQTVETGCCLLGSNKGRSYQKYSSVSRTPPFSRFYGKFHEIFSNSSISDHLSKFQHRFHPLQRRSTKF